MIAAFAFVLPFSLVRQMLKDKLGKRGRAWITDFGGILAGLSVSMSGNLHYIIYGKIFTLLGIREDYWFPGTTRFIGFDPPVTGTRQFMNFLHILLFLGIYMRM